MTSVDIGGAMLETRTIPGDPGLPWLVFLHEGLGCVSLWRDFPERVARRTGARALVYSRQGYGRSSPLAVAREPDFMHREALDVLPRLLQYFRIERPNLIGHSDGASIALIHAAADAGNAASVVLMAPHVFVEPVSVTAIERITHVYETTDLRARLARHHAHVDDAFLGWSRIWRDARFRDWTLLAEARALRVATLLIQGTADEYGTLAQVDAIADATLGPVQRLILEGAGHSPHRERDAIVIEAITNFVAAR